MPFVPCGWFFAFCFAVFFGTVVSLVPRYTAFLSNKPLITTSLETSFFVLWQVHLFPPTSLLSLPWQFLNMCSSHLHPSCFLLLLLLLFLFCCYITYCVYYCSCWNIDWSSWLDLVQGTITAVSSRVQWPCHVPDSTFHSPLPYLSPFLFSGICGVLLRGQTPQSLILNTVIS